MAAALEKITKKIAFDQMGQFASFELKMKIPQIYQK
jgi:hypothetical protein